MNVLSRMPLYLLNALLVYVCLFLIFFVISLFTGSAPKSSTTATYQTGTPNTSKSLRTPNIVTAGLSSSVNSLNKSLDSTGKQISTTTAYVSTTASYVAGTMLKQTGHIATTALRGVGSSIMFITKQTASLVTTVAATTGSIITNTARFIIAINVGVYGFVLNAPLNAVSAMTSQQNLTQIVTPSQNLADVPIIEPYSPEINQAIVALSDETTKQATVLSTQASETPSVRWPLEGRITTRFGVPHWPYQPVHSGIDISDNTASGVTPIYPFRAGTVIKTEESYRGLGNHVIVYHGNNITSVYAHLASINVSEGQDITTTTELGRQGTTGVSTGVHLHFEVRINGQATDPLPFLES